MYEKYKALEGEEWIWVASQPWLIGGEQIGYETNVVFKDGNKGPLNLTTVDDDLRLFKEIGSLKQAKARLSKISSETHEPHIVEETGAWFEGGAIDIEFEICEQGCE